MSLHIGNSYHPNNIVLKISVLLGFNVLHGKCLVMMLYKKTLITPVREKTSASTTKQKGMTRRQTAAKAVIYESYINRSQTIAIICKISNLYSTSDNSLVVTI